MASKQTTHYQAPGETRPKPQAFPDKGKSCEFFKTLETLQVCIPSVCIITFKLFLMWNDLRIVRLQNNFLIKDGATLTILLCFVKIVLVVT